MPDQDNWRFCGNCHGMFFNGSPDHSTCPSAATGGTHNPLGYVFVLPFDVPATATAQDQWRFCGNCHGMFFAGYPDFGVCPSPGTGGHHNPLGDNFVLPHDIAATPTAQDQWRFCGNCHGMFFAGYPNLGVCPSPGTGGHHNPLGYDFVLPHPISPVLRLVDAVTEVQVIGDRFTPNSNVTVSYGYNTAGSDVGLNTFGELTIQTDVDGHFDGETFPIAAEAFDIDARGVDEVTQTGTDATPLRPAV